ncbi:BrnA antitoxin family protein [Massilia sp. TS11]|uniref:BrnA antitoxin family protein n=1 Tax=Massilia sp. TS11 TaxID=2908003 RepID=UPI001EDC44CC|nr:BrnA antitoxin family protein [Massilia sp. TS11]MCG2585461.1 BrnA antitoxin family protein [Massilia sp. TS11]
MHTQIDSNRIEPATGVRARSNSRHGQATPVKQIVTIRLDTDMLAWFKAEGPGYQTRINQVLREYMENNPRIATAPVQDPSASA